MSDTEHHCSLTGVRSCKAFGELEPGEHFMLGPKVMVKMAGKANSGLGKAVGLNMGKPGEVVELLETMLVDSLGPLAEASVEGRTGAAVKAVVRIEMWTNFCNCKDTIEIDFDLDEWNAMTPDEKEEEARQAAMESFEWSYQDRTERIETP